MFRAYTKHLANLALAAGLTVTSSLALAQQPIGMGTSVNGVLTVSSPQWSDGSRYNAYTFMGQAGQTVTLQMASSQFDTYLILQDQMGNEVGRDDDGGGGTNSRLVATLGMTGVFRIIAKAYRSDLYGNYSLSLMGSAPMAMNTPQPMMGQPMTGPTQMGTIGANQQVTGNLTSMDGRWDGKPTQLWNFQCAAGQPFQMDILSTWDNYALVFDPAGNTVARDDDTGEGLNARINYTCAMAGMYRLAVTTYTASTTPGTYTLQVQAMAPTVAMNQPTPIPMAQPTPMAQPMQPTPMPTVQPTPQAMPGATMPQPAEDPMAITGTIPAPGQVGRIRMGTTMRGRLETGDQQMNDGTWADVWTFQGTAGVTVIIELRSEEFDTYLQLLDAPGNRLAEDDDSLGDLDARISFTLPATGEYQIVVNNFSDERRAGIYTLTLRIGSGGS